MRCLIFLLAGFSSFSSFSQTGSVVVNSFDLVSNEPISICVELKKDSSLLQADCIDSTGLKKFSNLPLGFVHLYFTQDGKDLGSKMAFIQENQVYQLPVRIDVNMKVSNSNARQFDISQNGALTESNLPSPQLTSRVIGGTGVRSSYQNIQAVMITAYRVPLINKSGCCSAYQMTSEDIKRMPVRS
ncbi:MAG: hypothetical protein HRT57_14840, partial [Crocinitomicaceae bacterium]|nr:hypothetical protein [Crocinitomicaceae bacterium]